MGQQAPWVRDARAEILFAAAAQRDFDQHIHVRIHEKSTGKARWTQSPRLFLIFVCLFITVSYCWFCTLGLFTTTMNANDLFSFLDDGAGAQEEQDVPAPISKATTNGQANGSNVVTDENAMDTAQDHEQATTQSEPSLKRKDRDADITSGGDTTMANGDDDEPGPSTKKPRVASPQPVVLDAVEIEARREVAASAGLTGGAEAADAKLELVSQVRCTYSFRRSSVLNLSLLTGPA